MMILNFLDPGQVPLILSGEKTQTTILHGPVELRVGDILQACSFQAGVRFGEVEITDIITQCEKITFENMPTATPKSWARKEGFKDFLKANRWFSRVHGLYWKSKYFDIVQFRGDWFPEEWT